MDHGGQVSEALLHRIKAGESPKHGKMGRPDMGRHKNSLRADIQGKLQQIVAGYAQDRPSVGMDVPHGLQLCSHPLRRLKVRQDNEVVDLPDPALLFVDGADLPGDDKAGLRKGSCRPGNCLLFLQGIKALLRRHQGLPQLLPPGRVGEVPGADEADALLPSCQGQCLHRQIFAGGSGISGMNVQICDIHI